MRLLISLLIAIYFADMVMIALAHPEYFLGEQHNKRQFYE